MTKLFLKSLFLIFGWIILLANLMFAFNSVQVVLGGYNSVANTGDLSTKYFGVTSLIDVFKGESFVKLAPILNDVRSYVDYVWSSARDLLTSPDVISSYWNHISNIGDFFNALGNTLVDVLKGIGSIFVYLYAMALNIIYFILVLVNFFMFLLSFFTGFYAKDLPNTDFPTIEEILRLNYIL